MWAWQWHLLFHPNSWIHSCPETCHFITLLIISAFIATHFIGRAIIQTFKKKKVQTMQIVSISEGYLVISWILPAEL